MGTSSFVKRTIAAPAQTVKQPWSFRLHLDIWLAVILFAMVVVGLMFVFSASWKHSMTEYKSVTYILESQIRFALGGLLLVVALSYFDYHWFKKLLFLMVFGTIAALIAVLVQGEVRNNAQRTLFGGSVQPSEFTMLTVIIYLSIWLVSKQDVLNKVTFGLIPLGLILGLFAALIFVQPDLSATLTILILGAVLFILAGAELRQILFLMGIGIVMIIALYFLTDTARIRIDQFIKGLISVGGASDHIKLALPAISAGQWLGVGIGRGSAKFEGLPFPWTDSIFAVIIEEIGIIGAMLVVLLYIFFVWRGLHIAKNAPDLLGRMLAGGVTFWIAFDAFVNMGVIVNLFPFAGNALPFMSAGGSSMISSMIGIGILMSVARVSKMTSNQNEGRSFSAVVDLRRRDRRRSVSRPLGSESPQE